MDSSTTAILPPRSKSSIPWPRSTWYLRSVRRSCNPEFRRVLASFPFFRRLFHFQRSDNMGLFDGLLGGVVGAEMATVVNGLIEKHGGVQGIVAQLEQQGLGGTVRSWVGTGANQPITAEQIHQAFGSDTVKELAAKLGLSPDVLAAKLSQVLPQAIDKLTPGGAAPKA